MERYVKPMKARPFDIEANKLVSIVREEDAKELGVLPLDRLEITNPRNKKRTTTVVDFTESMVGKGEIGLFKDVVDLLGIRDSQQLFVTASPQPQSVSFIKKKLKRQALSSEEIHAIVDDIAENRLSEIEAAAFMAAVYVNGYSLEETIFMTKALAEKGQKLRIKGPILDKHSIGGLNGRVTIILVPIIAAAGYKIPKTSSRSITSAAGTADSMEVLCNVSLSIKKIKEITEKVGGCIAWGGAVDLAPADDKIVKIEHPLSLDPEGQVIASVMAKKASVGATHLVIDLPVGPDVKISSKEKGEIMAKKFIEVGKSLGIRTEVLITDGTEPSGKAFGAALEAKYALEILEGKFFDNLAQKACELAGALFELVGRSEKGKGTALAKEILESGKAHKKMLEIIRAQGARALSSKEIKPARFVKRIPAPDSGEISRINVRTIINIARIAGAPADSKAGVMLFVEGGDKAKKAAPLFEIHAENKKKLYLAEAFAKKNCPIELQKAVLEKIC